MGEGEREREGDRKRVDKYCWVNIAKESCWQWAGSFWGGRTVELGGMGSMSQVCWNEWKQPGNLEAENFIVFHLLILCFFSSPGLQVLQVSTLIKFKLLHIQVGRWVGYCSSLWHSSIAMLSTWRSSRQLRVWRSFCIVLWCTNGFRGAAMLDSTKGSVRERVSGSGHG